MATVRDVSTFYGLAKARALLPGAPPGFPEETRRRFRAICDALRKDMRLSIEQLQRISLETPLSANAETRFEEWKEFNRKNDPLLKPV